MFAALHALLALPVLLSDGPSMRVVVASAVLGGVLAMLAAYDLDQMRLPDALTLPLGIAGLAATAWIGVAAVEVHAVAAAVGGVALWLVGYVYQRWRGRRGLGFGDVKLFAALSAWIGPAGLASVLLVACLTALAVLLAMRLTGRQLEASTPIPFGIFLALGGWTTWVYGPLT